MRFNPLLSPLLRWSYHLGQGRLPHSLRLRETAAAPALNGVTFSFKHAASTPAADLHDYAFRDSGTTQITSGSAAQIVEEKPGTPADLQALAHVSRKSLTGFPSGRVSTADSADFPATHCVGRRSRASAIGRRDE